MIIASDLHLTLDTEHLVAKVFKEIRRVAEAQQERHLALLGDIFDVRHVVPIRLLTAFVDMLDSLAGIIDSIDITPGNHDDWNLEGRNVLEPFARVSPDGSNYPSVDVHRQPGEVTGKLTWLPWIADHSFVRGAIAGPEPYVLGHLAVRGAWMNNLRVDEEGFPLEDLLAAKKKRILLGHYHRRHFVDPTQTVMYVGSPYQVSYAEAGQEKGLTIFDPYKNTINFAQLHVGPEHHKIVVDADHPEAIALPKAQPGDRVWVQVKGQMSSTLEDMVRKALDKGGIEISRFDVDMQVDAVAARAQLAPEETLKAIPPRYVDAQDVDAGYKLLLKQCFDKVVSS